MKKNLPKVIHSPTEKTIRNKSGKVKDLFFHGIQALSKSTIKTMMSDDET